jgi:uncharacterized tellurite resistance protein B-like protein
MIWIWLLLALVPLAIVVSGLVLCRPYWRSREKRWRDRVLSAYQAAERQLHFEQAELQRLSNKRRDQIESLSRKALERFLAGISVNELEAYPGIGPATIARLQESGYNNLAKLHHARIRVRGLGPKRLADVNGALRQLTGQAESRFQAGACPESQQLAAQLQQLEARYAERERRAKAQAQGAADLLRQLEPSAAIARQVTLWSYLWKDAHVVVPPDLLHQALPDLHAALASAERQASKALRGREATANPPSEIKSRQVLPNVAASPRPDTFPVAHPVAGTRPSPKAARIPEGTKAEGPASGRSVDRLPSSSHSAPAPTAKRPPPPQTASDPAQELLEATIAFAFAVARTDGSISGKERAFLEEQVRRRYSHDTALYNRAKAWCAHYETSAIDIASCLHRIKQGFTPAQRAELLEFACQLAQASGPMNQREGRLLERASREWGLPWKPRSLMWRGQETTPQRGAKECAPGPAATVPQSSPALEPRALLQIDPSAPLTADLIRRQYNLLSSRLAAEKVEAMGVEFVAMAESKRQALRAAAETLLQPLGEPLEPPARPAEPAELRHNPDLDAMFGA